MGMKSGEYEFDIIDVGCVDVGGQCGTFRVWLLDV